MASLAGLVLAGAMSTAIAGTAVVASRSSHPISTFLTWQRSCATSTPMPTSTPAHCPARAPSEDWNPSSTWPACRSAQGTDDGRQRLFTLYEAVSMGTAAQLDDVALPARFFATPEDRHEVRAWLWRVLLADGTRTFTTKGRCDEALAHIKQHRGIGKRMLDGRQVSDQLATGLRTSDRTIRESLTRT